MQKAGFLTTRLILQHVVPKPRTKAWISTSIPQEKWGSELSKNCSADYLVNNLTSPVLFQEGLQHIPPTAVVIEIGPHALLQAILKRSLDPKAFYCGLMKRNNAAENVQFFLENLGKYVSSWIRQFRKTDLQMSRDL